MQRLLMMLSICGFPALVFAEEPGNVSGSSRKFKRADKITVVFTERDKIVDQLKTNVVDILPNGDLKIYGEVITVAGRETRRMTLSGTIRPANISADGTVDSDVITNLDITITYHKKRSESEKLVQKAMLVGMDLILRAVLIP